MLIGIFEYTIDVAAGFIELNIIIYTSMQFWPSAALLARPTLGRLWSQNCLK